MCVYCNAFNDPFPQTDAPSIMCTQRRMHKVISKAITVLLDKYAPYHLFFFSQGISVLIPFIFVTVDTLNRSIRVWKDFKILPEPAWKCNVKNANIKTLHQNRYTRYITATKSKIIRMYHVKQCGFNLFASLKRYSQHATPPQQPPPW